jgi:hypothetical protein
MTADDDVRADLALLPSGREHGMKHAVDTRALHESVTTVEEVLARVRTLGVAEDLRPVAAAVPGGRTASSLSHVAAAWQARLSGTWWEVRELGLAVAMAADAYDAVETAVGDTVAHSRRPGSEAGR